MGVLSGNSSQLVEPTCIIPSTIFGRVPVMILHSFLFLGVWGKGATEFGSLVPTGGGKLFTVPGG